ncbi:hypothetical protein ACXYX3_14350 [Mycobacterium sp. C3-094]
MAGAKHKLSRAQKIALRAASSRTPSVLATSTIHAIRRYIAGAAPANGLEERIFGVLAHMPREFLQCAVDGVDQLPPGQRDVLFTPGLIADPNAPIDISDLAAALDKELSIRAAIEVFGDAAAVDGERPGLNRLYEPQGEDFFSQVRICRVSNLRTASYIPSLQPSEYQPDEFQQDCEATIVDGEPRVVCEIRASDCYGNQLAGACGRVLDVMQGDGVSVEGVNYFDTNAVVRLTDKDTGTIQRRFPERMLSTTS